MSFEHGESVTGPELSETVREFIDRYGHLEVTYTIEPEDGSEPRVVSGTVAAALSNDDDKGGCEHLRSMVDASPDLAAIIIADCVERSGSPIQG